jgi:hypothetical protein
MPVPVARPARLRWLTRAASLVALGGATLAPSLVRAGEPTAAPASSATAERPSGAGAQPDKATEEALPLAIIGPVLTPVGGTEKEPVKKVGPNDPLAARAREVESALKEALQDLGLALDVAAQLPGDGIRELDLVQRAAQGNGAWIISPRLEQQGSDKFLLRMVAVPPKGATLLVRVEQVDGAHLAARAVVMLRDLVAMKLTPAPTNAAGDAIPRVEEDEAGRSRGRPVLAVSSSLLGLYVALAIDRSAGKDDPRLLYPLLLLGSGIGLGASLLAADEWNVTPGAAWTVAAGSLWGTLAGLNIAAGRDVQPVSSRYSYGLVGGLGGTALSIVALAATPFDDGDAAIVHSSAAIGTFTGGLVEALWRGDLGTRDSSPSKGFGWGSATGLVAGGVVASLVRTTPSRVFLIDLGCGIGALGGAAVTSPLVFKDITEAKTRGFVTGVLAGTVLGGTIAYFVTRGRKPDATAEAGPRVLPTAGVLGVSTAKNGSTAPIFGAGLMGSF